MVMRALGRRSVVEDWGSSDEWGCAEPPVGNRNMSQEMQKRVAEFVEAHGLGTDVAYRLLDLVSEIGELSKEALKATHYGKTTFQKNEDWEQELGDALFSLICVANATGVDLEAALAKVLTKYQNRIDETQDVGSGR